MRQTWGCPCFRNAPIGRNYHIAGYTESRYGGGMSRPPGESRNQSPSDINAALREALAAQQFDSLEDAQAFIARFTQVRNQAPLDEFHGLSPEDMFHVLHHPYDAPHVAKWAEHLDVAPQAPILSLFLALATQLNAGSHKATAKGNLPREVCRTVTRNVLGDDGYKEATKYAGINREEDYFDLHVTRLVAQRAGLIRKHKRCFVLSRECQSLLDSDARGEMYLRLLRAFTQQYNWRYGDGYPPISIIQQSFLYTLYLLSRYGSQKLPTEFYAEQFIRAFPAVLDEVPETTYATAEDTLAHCYALRALERFAAFFGLCTYTRVGERTERRYEVEKLPLLDAVIRFHIAP